MNCIVTAGPGFEPIDQVRRITNFSTGQLGSGLASFLLGRGHSVILFKGVGATAPLPDSLRAARSFSTGATLKQQLESLAGPSVDAVFHAAALADFQVGQIRTNTPLTAVEASKIPTGVGSIWVELVPAEKIIRCLRDWFPTAFIVGWKYEVAGSREEVVEKGRAQMETCRTNACVLNGPAYGRDFGVLNADGGLVSCEGADALYAYLEIAAARPR